MQIYKYCTAFPLIAPIKCVIIYNSNSIIKGILKNNYFLRADVLNVCSFYIFKERGKNNDMDINNSMDTNMV